MSTLSGPLTHDDRDVLAYTAQTLALLPLAHTHELAAALDCIAQSRYPRPDTVAEAMRHAATVQSTLLADASPDRWISEVTEMGGDMEVVADMIEQRRAQALQVGQCLAILAKIGTRTRATA